MTAHHDETRARLEALRACLDEPAGRYLELRGARDLGEYLTPPIEGADEEVLTEPILAAIIERVLGFPVDAYFPQRGRRGSKPDFTPIDMIAHSFVLDAKGSDQRLGSHERQIRRYMDERGLDHGILFNLREMRVYRRGGAGHEPGLSFRVLPLWQVARAEAMPAPEVAAFAAFCELFAHRTMSQEERIGHIRRQEPWSARLAAGEPVRVDVDFLVETLRRLSRGLSADAGAQPHQLDSFLALHPGRARRLVRELELLALDLVPGTDVKRLPKDAVGWRTTSGLPARVWRQYLRRVADLALTRILLYRAWEDVEFVRDYLYDGGFGDAYDRLAGRVRAVLEEAFAQGAQRYPWLYGGDNNYDWFRPREPALVEVLYSLAPVPLGRLDADVLGDLYQSYVDEIDRDRLGQFFTPRSVVRFMLDRAGFRGPTGVFRIEGDTRTPRRVFDFATGSGGFLVEAARRIIDEGGVAQDDVRGLNEALRAVVTGLVGGEISPFPYYLTEINLLLQVSRLLGRLNLAGDRPPTFTLGALHVDSLMAAADPAASLDVDPALRADRARLQADERFGMTPLDGEKQATFDALRTGDGFDLVIGNPPYVSEASNKALFERLRAIPAWRHVYRGKTDYLYYFLLLALEKVAPGGRICVITPAGWMNAGAADFMRSALVRDLRLDLLVLFGSHRLFVPEHESGGGRRRAPTPTVESAILVATRMAPPAGHRLRVVALEDEAEAARALTGDPEARVPGRDALLAELTRRTRGEPGRRDGVHVHDVPQADLVADRPWPVKHSAEDLPTRVVAHLQALLDDDSVPVEPLSASWKVFMGIETGADAFSKRIDKRLTNEQRAELALAGAELGDPIMELPAGTETSDPWRGHAELLARSPEASGILYGAVDPTDYVSMVMLDRSAPPPDVLAHLLRWRPILASRAEIARNPRRAWWETAWPRNLDDLRAAKVIAVHRTDRGRFAVDENGSWRPNKKAATVVGRTDGAPVAYLCGLLNSELLDQWTALRGRTPWHVRRDYEPKRMNEIPYRRPEGDPRGDEIASLVRLIAANRRALLPHRAVFPELTRTVKDPWRTERPAVDPAAAVAALPTAQTISVRLDPELACTPADPAAGRPRRLDPGTLVLRRGRTEVGRIVGPPERLDLLEGLIGSGADPLSVLVPANLDDLSALIEGRREEVARLLDEGRALVERVERLVCGLYDLPDALTDEVVAHAVRRAGAASPDEDDAEDDVASDRPPGATHYCADIDDFLQT